MENAKLSKSAAVIDRILKILQGFAIAGVIVSAIFIPLTLILGKKIIADASSLELGVVTLKLAGDMSAYLDEGSIKLSIVCTLVCLMVISAAVWFCFRVLREVLAPMKAGNPFARGIARRIRRLAWTVLIGGGIAEFASVLAEIFETRAYHMERLLNPDRIASVAYSFSIDLWFVIAALVLFFLSFIFRYGKELQREADETL